MTFDPAMLDNLGLASALENIAAELAQRSGIEVRVVQDVREDRLLELQALTLFRIAQEALRTRNACQRLPDRHRAGGGRCPGGAASHR